MRDVFGLMKEGDGNCISIGVVGLLGSLEGAEDAVEALRFPKKRSIRSRPVAIAMAEKRGTFLSLVVQEKVRLLL